MYSSGGRWPPRPHEALERRRQRSTVIIARCDDLILCWWNNGLGRELKYGAFKRPWVQRTRHKEPLSQIYVFLSEMVNLLGRLYSLSKCRETEVAPELDESAD
jgi:hypothetical protein